MEPGTVMPIHRHKGSSETCICIRGHFEEYFYDAEGRLTDTIDMVADGVVLNIEKGQWHSLKCLESGTVLFEAKVPTRLCGMPPRHAMLIRIISIRPLGITTA